MSINAGEPISFGQVGLGGFGGSILASLRRLERAASPKGKLVAVCEPAQELHAAAIAQLRREGITVVRDLREMLALPVQALWMPVPIHLHRPFTEAALTAGKWVLCEKPAAGVLQDIDAMIQARDQHRGKVAIAFQDIHERATPQIKQRLLDGVIGRIKRVSIVALWPRAASYFARNDWAGHLRRGDTWILDCPATNANAHSLNFALFLLGADLNTSARPECVEAELYRARDIESADTVCIRTRTVGGSEVLFLATHACERHVDVQMVFYGEKGELHISPSAAEFRFADGTTQKIDREIQIERSAEVALEHWTSVPDPAPLATLEVAYRQTQVVNGAFDAAPIQTIDPRMIQATGSGKDLQPMLSGIEPLFMECGRRGALPHETGLAPWTKPAGRLDLRDYTAFRGTHCRQTAG